MSDVKDFNIIVVGLGYVGLPLAIALARRFRVTGLDIDERRIEELGRRHDRTGEVDSEALATTSLRLTFRPEECRGADLYIVTVPTPVDADNRPDLAALTGASCTVGGLLEKNGAIVVGPYPMYIRISGGKNN